MHTKFKLLLFFLFVAGSCIAQSDAYKVFEFEWEAGRTFGLSASKNRLDTGGYVFTFKHVYPQYDTLIGRVSPHIIDSCKAKGLTTHRICIKNSFLWVWHDRLFINGYDHIPFCIVATEIAGEYHTVDLNDSLTFTYKYFKELVASSSQLYYQKVNRKPSSLPKFSYYYPEMPKVRQIGLPKCFIPTTEDVEMALNELGYCLPINNVLEQHDKIAILDFQRKNNLFEGSLDTETMRYLGLL